MDWISVLLLCVVLTLPLSALAAPAPLMLAKVYQGYEQVSDYLVSEKLDGVRVYWSGQALFTRSGYRVNAPDWFVAPLPGVPLDGELWAGRGRFAEVNGVIQSYQADDARWKQLTLMVFDAPADPERFARRYQNLQTLFSGVSASWLQLLEQREVSDQARLQTLLQDVSQQGGEGLMLHRRTARYEVGRTPHLLKLKTLHDDEATVIGYVPGKGKYQGMVGSLRVQLKDGRELRLGSGLSDALRRNPPPLGTQVTFAYNGLTNKGLPRFARFMRVRSQSL